MSFLPFKIVSKVQNKTEKFQSITFDHIEKIILHRRLTLGQPFDASTFHSNLLFRIYSIGFESSKLRHFEKTS